MCTCVLLINLAPELKSWLCYRHKYWMSTWTVKLWKTLLWIPFRFGHSHLKFLIPPQPKFHFILVRFSHFGLFRLILARALISVGTDRAKHLPYLSTLWLLSTTLPVTWMNPSHGKGCIFFVLSAGHSSVRFWIFVYLDLSFLFCSVSLDSWIGIGMTKEA